MKLKDLFTPEPLPVWWCGNYASPAHYGRHHIKIIKKKNGFYRQEFCEETNKYIEVKFKRIK